MSKLVPRPCLFLPRSGLTCHSLSSTHLVDIYLKCQFYFTRVANLKFLIKMFLVRARLGCLELIQNDKVGKGHSN